MCKLVMTLENLEREIAGPRSTQFTRGTSGTKLKCAWKSYMRGNELFLLVIHNFPIHTTF